MKIIIFALVSLILVAASTLAAGLEITEIDVNVDYDEAYVYRLEKKDRISSTSVPVANNSKIDADILPGSNVTFTVRVENTFREPDLRNAFVTITIEDIDDGADLEEESTDFDLEPGDDNRADIEFGIPLDVDSGTYNVILESEGEDKNETRYRTKLNLKLEVKKQSHDIRITNVLLNPSTVDCNRKTKLTAEITNAGSNAENQVALEFKSGNLGINSFDRDIFLESSDEASDEEKMHAKALNIEVPSFLNAGNYPIFVNLYWKNFVLFDQKTVDLIVRDCVSGGTKTDQKHESKEEAEPVVVIKPEEKTKEEANKDLITATKEVSVFNPPLLIAILLGGFVIIVIIAFVYLKVKHKSHRRIQV